jgi:hypothetical protein
MGEAGYTGKREESMAYNIPPITGGFPPEDDDFHALNEMRGQYQQGIYSAFGVPLDVIEPDPEKRNNYLGAFDRMTEPERNKPDSWKWDGTADVATFIRDQWAKRRNQHIEMMAAAYLQETNLNPEEVELVEVQEGNLIRWYFRKRSAE